jgi:hypothetical protein
MTIYISKSILFFTFPFLLVVILLLWHFFLFFHFLFKQIFFIFTCVSTYFQYFSFLFTLNHHITTFLNWFFLFFYNLLLPNLNINITLLKYNCSPILRQGKSSCFSFFFGSRVQNKQNIHFMAQMGTQRITHSHMTSFYLAK